MIAHEMTVTVADGREVEVRLIHDPDTDPRTDGDWASPEVVEAWRADRWGYVIVEVTYQGVSACIGGVCWGDVPGVATGEIEGHVIGDLVPNLLVDIDERVAKDKTSRASELLNAMIDYYVNAYPYQGQFVPEAYGMRELIIRAYMYVHGVCEDDASETLAEILTDAYIARAGA